MGYNTSKATVKRMEPYLRRMWTAKHDLEWAHESPSSLAYRIREAIHAAQFHDAYSHYHKLGDMYKVRALQSTVQADYTNRRPTEVRTTVSDQPVRHELVKAPSEEHLTVPEANTLHAVIGAGLKYKTAEELHFPNAQLLPPDMKKLHAWASSANWKIIDHESEGLTLTKRDIDDELIWTPESK